MTLLRKLATTLFGVGGASHLDYLRSKPNRPRG